MRIIARGAWGARYGQGATIAGPVSLVVVHHTAGPDLGPAASEQREVEVVRRIEEQHGAPKPKGNGWAGIGYNWLVFPSGRVYEGRGWRREGAHTPGKNKESVGVAFVMDAEATEPTAEAMQACQDLLAFGVLGNHIAPGFEVRGHRDFTATKCPGARLYVRLGQLRAPVRPAEDESRREVREALEEIRRHLARIEATL
jgi:N-acetylmuramoyl-L-alanine amidase